MITGTIIGEISTLMIDVRAGKFARLSPNAASVPSVVAMTVVKAATMMLVLRASTQRSLVKKSSYQRSDRPGMG